MKFSFPLFIIIFFILVTSCNSEKSKLLNEYNDIEKLIANNNTAAILSKLDQKSLDFVSYLTDTRNLNYETMKAYGKENKLMLFTSVYNKDFGDIIRNSEAKKAIFFTYLKLLDVPMFNPLMDAKILEDKSKNDKYTKYVMIRTPINKRAYITSKIRFSEDDKGALKLNLLSALKLREKFLGQQYKKYKNLAVQMKDYDYNKDALLDFLNVMKNEKYDIDEIRYNKNIK